MWLRAERKFVHLTNATLYTLSVSNNRIIKMKRTDELFMELSMYKNAGSIIKVMLIDKNIEEFITKVSEFKSDEDDTKVIFKRCAETAFYPSVEETFMTYIKNIQTIEFIE